LGFCRHESFGSNFAGRNRSGVLVWLILVLSLLFVAGCAKYNTYFNAKRDFDEAEHVREEAIRKHQDPPEPSGNQKTKYLDSIKKAQKILDEYPGHSLTDDALFLQAKAHSRLSSYRQSIKKLELLFLNYPATEYQEEALYLQALNYLMVGALDRSQEYLDMLSSQYPDSKFQSETLKVSGDNSYALEDWETAVSSYQDYLDQFPKDKEVDRIGLKLAECYWELDNYQRASEVLQIVSDATTSAELGFRSRLLRARVHVRLGDFEVTEMLLGGLREEAPIYSSEGQVVLIEAESLVAQGKGQDAAPLIESMPVEWNTPIVKARAADILGYLYLERGELEDASAQFLIAVTGRDQLDDYNKTRILNQNLKDYLAAETALPDASAQRVPRLKLLQANALLFGFNRPAEAALLFREAGLDTAADSLLAPRGLYGTVVVYRDYLDQPDSAGIYSDLLLQRYPNSPQAFELEVGGDGNLLGFLLAQQDSIQVAYLASLTPEELAELQKSTVVSGPNRAGRSSEFEGVRRQMVYLSRRDNLVYEPSEVTVEGVKARLETQRAKRLQDAAEIQAVDQKLQADGLISSDMPDSNSVIGGEFLLDPESDEKATTPVEVPEEQPAVDEEKEKEEKKKKEEDDGGFDLRSP
jgi:tetratricopeptide (TPR) repeat protein